MDDFVVASTLTGVTRAAETTRSTLAHVTLRPDSSSLEDAAARLAATAAALDSLRHVIADSALRFQAAVPLAVPANAAERAYAAGAHRHSQLHPHPQTHTPHARALQCRSCCAPRWTRTWRRRTAPLKSWAAC